MNFGKVYAPGLCGFEARDD